VKAYDLYLRARTLEYQRGVPGLSESVDALEEVIAKDASFAPAYAALAAAHAARSGQFRFNVPEEMLKMRAAAENAIRLDPLLAEAHDALGMVHARDARWQLSEQCFRRALEIDPGRSHTRGHFAAYCLWPLGRMREAVEQVREAEKAEPLSADVQAWLGFVLIAAGEYDEAAVHCLKQPANLWSRPECLGRVRLGQGRTREAIEVLEMAFNRGRTAGSEVRGYLGYAYARAGRREDAEKMAAATPSINPFNHALIFAGLGDKDRTFDALDRAAAGWAFSDRQSPSVSRIRFAAQGSASERAAQESRVTGIARTGRRQRSWIPTCAARASALLRDCFHKQCQGVL
jgi:tetratricopeptide (TPR) repeat protein